MGYNIAGGFNRQASAITGSGAYGVQEVGNLAGGRTAYDAPAPAMDIADSEDAGAMSAGVTTGEGMERGYEGPEQSMESQAAEYGAYGLDFYGGFSEAYDAYSGAKSNVERGVTAASMVAPDTMASFSTAWGPLGLTAGAIAFGIKGYQAQMEKEQMAAEYGPANVAAEMDFGSIAGTTSNKEAQAAQLDYEGYSLEAVKENPDLHAALQKSLFENMIAQQKTKQDWSAMKSAYAEREALEGYTDPGTQVSQHGGFAFAGTDQQRGWDEVEVGPDLAEAITHEVDITNRDFAGFTTQDLAHMRADEQQEAAEKAAAQQASDQAAADAAAGLGDAGFGDTSADTSGLGAFGFGD